MELRSTNIQIIQYYRCVYVCNRRCEPGCTIYIIFRIIFVLCASRYATGLKSLFAVLCNQPVLLKVMRMFLYYLICVICHLYFVCIINHGIAGIKPASFICFILPPEVIAGMAGTVGAWTGKA